METSVTLKPIDGHPSVQTEPEATYIQAATSDNTRIAYQSDIQHFIKWGGALPAAPQQVEVYLRECAQRYNPRTLKRRIITLRQWHKLKSQPDPTSAPNVIKTMQGIARLHGVPAKQAAALKLKDLDAINTNIGEALTNDELANRVYLRNRALLLIGFFGAFRRSELVSLHWEQVHFVSDGVIIKLSRSKTDQTGQGADCVIPFGNALRCPVRALLDWRKASQQFAGPIFRRISKTGTVSGSAISGQSVNLILRQLAHDAGLTNAAQMSAHSLRRGFATESARLGASMPSIQRHGRWRSTKTVVEYIEAGRQFVDSAVNVLFDFGVE
jgi:site-specific recombinase XerD